jgi:hypothetical protein
MPPMKSRAPARRCRSARTQRFDLDELETCRWRGDRHLPCGVVPGDRAGLAGDHDVEPASRMGVRRQRLTRPEPDAADADVFVLHFDDMCRGVVGAARYRLGPRA